MPVTQKDIAQRLNLSQSTVTKVLNNRPDVWVSDENRQRIHLAAHEMNYRPNTAARALRNGKYKSVTFVLQRSEGLFLRIGYSLAIEVLAERLGEFGYELKVKVLPDQEQLLNSLNDLASTRDTDAVILWGEENTVEEQADILERAGIPFVVKGRFELNHPNWPQVDFDHEEMMSTLVRNLTQTGFHRIAYLGTDSQGIFSQRLFAGYCKAVQFWNDPLAEELVAHIEATADAAEAQMDTWLALPKDLQPTAIVISGANLHWQGVETALAKKSRCIGEGPNDFAVSGINIGPLTLSFGHAYSYQDTGFDDLANALFEHLLSPLLLKKSIENPIVRILPNLMPAYSLEQLNYVSFKKP